MINVFALTKAMVDLEEEILDRVKWWDCMSDACDHEEECPDPPGIGCGDAARLAELYKEAVENAQHERSHEAGASPSPAPGG